MFARLFPDLTRSVSAFLYFLVLLSNESCGFTVLQVAGRRLCRKAGVRGKEEDEPQYYIVHVHTHMHCTVHDSRVLFSWDHAAYGNCCGFALNG